MGLLAECWPKYRFYQRPTSRLTWWNRACSSYFWWFVSSWGRKGTRCTWSLDGFPRATWITTQGVYRAIWTRSCSQRSKTFEWIHSSAKEIAKACRRDKAVLRRRTWSSHRLTDLRTPMPVPWTTQFNNNLTFPRTTTRRKRPCLLLTLWSKWLCKKLKSSELSCFRLQRVSITHRCFIKSLIRCMRTWSSASLLWSSSSQT